MPSTPTPELSSPTGKSGRQCEDILAQGQQSEKYTRFLNLPQGRWDQFQQGMEVAAILLLVKTILSLTRKSLC